MNALLTRHQRYYAKNRLKELARKKARLSCPEGRAKRAAYYKKWAAANRSKVRAKTRAWRRKNPEKLRESQRRSLLRNPNTVLANVLRTRLRLALKGQTKVASTLELLGCTVVDLRQHLQAQFKPGMSWANYGEWHIDHKRPCASFDLSDPAQQRVCFHYTNLQPLWAEENFTKNAKYSFGKN